MPTEDHRLERGGGDNDGVAAVKKADGCQRSYHCFLDKIAGRWRGTTVMRASGTGLSFTLGESVTKTPPLSGCNGNRSRQFCSKIFADKVGYSHKLYKNCIKSHKGVSCL